MDSQGQVVEWDSTAEDLFGYRSGEAVGRRLGDLIVPPEIRPFHEAGLARYVATREGHSVNRVFELEALHQAGHTVSIALMVRPKEVDGQLFFEAQIRSR
jgi:PAS domain S-box-containing protein